MNNFFLGFISCIGLLLIINCLVIGAVGRANNKINACLLDAVTQQIITIEQEKALEQLLKRINNE